VRKAILEFNSYLTGSDVGKIKFLQGISCVSKSDYARCSSFSSILSSKEYNKSPKK